MKNVRIFLAAFVLLAVASAFVTPKHHVKSVQKHNKFLTHVSKEMAWQGSDFVIASETSSTPLSTLTNWSAYQTTGTQGCANNGKVCSAIVTYTYDEAAAPPQTDPLPTRTEVANAIAAAYTPGSPSAFTTPISFVKNGITINILIAEKN